MVKCAKGYLESQLRSDANYTCKLTSTEYDDHVKLDFPFCQDQGRNI